MQCTEDSVDALSDHPHPNPTGEPPGSSAASGPSKPPSVYRMDYPRRGRSIIISNRDFEPKTGVAKRTGTDKDASQLEQLCGSLQFETVRKDNQTCADMLRLLDKEAKRDHSDEACFMCCILSHGEEGKLYGTDGMINIDTLTGCFKGDRCPSLAGKPKIFIIQACRGPKLDFGAEITDARPEMSNIHPIEEQPNFYRIPSEADFLMAYSVVPGYFSWRDSSQGSWFIQAFCAVMTQYGEKEEMMTLLTRVNEKVAYDFESHTAQEFLNRMKQMPCMVTMLTKQLYFSKLTA